MNEHGFTLVEVLLASAILVLVAVAILPAMLVQLDTNTRNAERSGAMNAAETVLEELRLQDPATMPMKGHSAPKLIAVGNRAYSVVTHYCERRSLCADATSRHLRVEVHENGEYVFDVETVFTQLR